MKLGIIFDGFETSADMLATARAAEDAGADSLWFAQHMGYRDALVWAGAVAAMTSKPTLVPLAISPYLCPPLPLAMHMATISELAGGRAAVSVGVGNLLNLAESGVAAVKPIRVMRDYIRMLRDLFAGHAVEQDGEIHRLANAHMNFTTADIPIYIASTGPQMLKLSGEIADGLVLSAGLTLTSCRACLDHAEAGLAAKNRDPAAFRRAGLIYVGVSENPAEARAMVRRKLAFLFRNSAQAANIASAGLDIDHAGIIAAMERRDLDAATALVPDAAATAFAVAGTVAQCRDQLEAYLTVGMDEPLLGMMGKPELCMQIVRSLSR
jgi:5,10-methylenetetrahydromethanopterin reductase